MERLFSAPVVVAIWGLMNVVAVALLAGFHAAGSHGDTVELYIYVGSALLVFLLALLAWLARRHRRQAIERGLVVPRRPASALMLALAFTMLWLGLPFGMWVPILAAFPLGVAALMEFYAIRAPRKLPAILLVLAVQGSKRAGSFQAGADVEVVEPGPDLFGHPVRGRQRDEVARGRPEQLHGLPRLHDGPGFLRQRPADRGVGPPLNGDAVAFPFAELPGVGAL
jgi:hypothetical protein